MSGVIEDIFATLLRVRQAEFASRQQDENPNAWDTGAAEPGVSIDIHRTLSNQEFDNAWKRWRQQWEDRVPLTPEQKKAKRTKSGNAFHKDMRSAFNAFLKNFMS